MKNITYMTLADARNEDPAKFDSIIRESVRQASGDVGREVMIQAFCNPVRIQEQRKVA